MVNKGRKSSNILAVGEELLVEILCRVGVAKQAIQCKSVCKLWCSLVSVNTDSSSYFLQHWRQINYNVSTELLLLTLIVRYERYVEPRERKPPCYHHLDSRYEILPKEESLSLNLDFLPCGRSTNQVHVLGCDKDLVLCCPNKTDHSCYYVCNPVTKQWTVLPPVPKVGDFSLYDNTRTKAGIIVHADDGHFTVVRMVPYRAMNKLFVFSSGGGGWRRIDNNSNGVIGLGSYLEGTSLERIDTYKETLVCLMKPRWLGEIGEDYTCFTLDPRNGQHAPLPLPERDGSYIRRSVMGVSEGRLRFSEFVSDEKKLIVWQFDDEEGRQEWDKVQEWDLGDMEDGSEDWQRARGRCECKGGWKAEAFHPHDRDVLYLFYSTRCRPQCEGNGWSFMFSCNLNKKRPSAVLIWDIPLTRGGYYFKLFPLVPQCWPTPIPLLSD